MVIVIFFKMFSLFIHSIILIFSGGVCPTTSKEAISPEAVRDVLSLMHSCGMYNYSGQFAFNVS